MKLLWLKQGGPKMSSLCSCFPLSIPLISPTAWCKNTVKEENRDLQWDAVICSRSYSAGEGKAHAHASAFSTFTFEQFLRFFQN